MTIQGKHGFEGKRAQRGASLLLALVFVSLFGGALASISAFNAVRVRENEARVTGHELVEIAKAARLFVRDMMIENDPTRTALGIDPDDDLRDILSTGPQRITLATLKNAGYLSPNFGRVVAGDDLTALGQRIYVVATNWPVGADPEDDSTVPTAFVLLRDSAKSTPRLMMDAVEVARSQDSSVTAPLFDNTDANISPICDIGAATSLWDTGCLSESDFDSLMAAIPTPPSTLEAGGLMIPAWKVVQPDLRAVMRFPQPENPGFATMLTDLQMGTPKGDCSVAANQVEITTTDSSGAIIDEQLDDLCDVESDTAMSNNRFNISQVSNMALQRVIAKPQEDTDNTGFDPSGIPNPAEAADIGDANDDAMRINGELVLGNDLRVYDGDIPSGVTHRLNIPNGNTLVERNAYLYSMDIANRGDATFQGTANALNLVSRSLETPQFDSQTASDATYGGDTPSLNVAVSTIMADNPATLGIREGTMRVTGAPTAELIAAEALYANRVGSDDLTTPFNDTLRGMPGVGGSDIRATDTTHPNAVNGDGTTGGYVQISSMLNAGNGQIQVMGDADPGDGVDYRITSGGRTYSAIIGKLSQGSNVQVDDLMEYSSDFTADPSDATQIRANSIRNYNADADASTHIEPMLSISATTNCLADNKIANGCPNRQYVPPGITP